MQALPLLRNLVLWLFFFNALLDRLATHYLGLAVFTTLFYACAGLAFALRCGSFALKGASGSILQVSTILFLAFVFVLGAFYGSPLASIYGIKQFFLGAVLLLIFADAPPSARRVLVLVILVQAYALFQGIYFLTQGFQLPPWDAEYIAQTLESQEAQNLYVGDLIRPFATFASFFEYQVSTHAIATGLFLTRRSFDLGTSRLATFSLISTLAVDVLLPERTPIMLAAIAFVVALSGSHLLMAAMKRDQRLLKGLALVGIVGASFIVVPALWIDSANPMLQRTAESFRFWEAETIEDRAAAPWELAMATVKTYPEGVGPAEVATSYNPGAQTPHNNLLLFAIGYSVFFPLLFFFYVGVAFWPLFRGVTSADEARSRVAFTGLGLVLGYLVAGQFNSPFSSYPGAALFLVLAMLHALVAGPKPISLPAARPGPVLATR